MERMEPGWHHTARALFIVAFVLIWLEAAGCFVCFQILLRTASPVATPELAAAVTDHGSTFYVAAWQSELYNLMLKMMGFAIPGIMLVGFLLHYLVGVKIFTNRDRSIL